MAGGRTKAPPLRLWARDLAEANPESSPIDLVSRVVERVRAAVAVSAGGAVPQFHEDLPEPPDGWANPWLPGLVHEQAVSAEDRGARGAWYTPEPVVRGLVRLATNDPSTVPDFAADPTCGGGAFLLAALDRYVVLGVPVEQALTRVAGMDIDADAVTVSRWSIELWAALNGVPQERVHTDITRGDALAGHPTHWPPVRLVVGNPPFATPLRTGAVPPEVAAFRSGREELLGPYTDLAAMHLLAAVERCEPGSIVALVLPQSVLAVRDSGPLRSHCDEVAPLHALWAAREPVFDAGVRACAAILKPGSERPGRVRLAAGPEVTEVGQSPQADPQIASSWSACAAQALGAPELPAVLRGSITADDRLGSLVTATAGFRDEYYGLVAACEEWTGEVGAEPNHLLTVGGVEPLASRWGQDRCRFGGKHWLRPWIDVDRLEPKVRTWTERRLSPKVVVATQSKLLEPVIDRSGRIVPATPLLAVHADEEDLGFVAAVFLSPPVVAWAWQQWFGSALAVDALKLAARQVVELPLPADRGAWAEAASMLEEQQAETVAEGLALSGAVAEIMNRAYGADRSVLDWWRARAKTVAT